MSARPRLPRGSLFYLHRQLLLEALAEAASCIQGLVLDVGCLDKPYQRFFGERASGWIGVDLPRHFGQRSAAEAYGEITAMPFRAGVFRTILCTEVLYMVADPPRAFAELQRVLRPGGYLLLSANQQAIQAAEPPDYFRFTRFGLEHLARQAGLEVVYTAPIGGAIAMVSFAAWSHLAPLRRQNPLASVVSARLQELALAADRRWPRPRNAIGWLLVARKPT